LGENELDAAENLSFVSERPTLYLVLFVLVQTQYALHNHISKGGSTSTTCFVVWLL